MKPIFRNTYEGDTLVDRMIGFVPHDFCTVKDDYHGDKVPFAVGSNQGLEEVPTFEDEFDDPLEIAMTAATLWEWVLECREGYPISDLLAEYGYATFRQIVCEMAPAVELMWEEFEDQGSEPFDWEFAPRIMGEQVMWNSLKPVPA